TLTISNLQLADAGNYRVVVTNVFGSATSSVAILSVSDAKPTILDQPQNQVSYPSGNVRFDLNFAGSEPAFFQWRFNDEDIPGETQPVLILTNLTKNQAGNYSVVVSNAFGFAVSSNAVLSIGNVAAWGNNYYGQTSVPAGLTNAIAVAAGYEHSLALKADGTVVAWGGNSDGQTNVPPGLSNVVAIAAGGWHSVALKKDGTVVAWGYNSNGQTNVPANLTNVIAITAGESDCYALTSDGTVFGWGWHVSGQVNPPGQTFTNIVEISSGRTHELALKNNGTAVSWGDVSFGLSNVPPALNNAVAISTRNDFNLALNSNGTVFAWGQNDQGQTNVPPGLSNVVAIAAGTAHAAALLANGKIVSWGSGDATNVPAGLSNAIRIAAGDIHTLAIIGDQPPEIFASPKNITRGNGVSQIHVPTLSGKIYILEFKDSLTNPDWTALPSTAGNGTIQTLIDSTATGPQRFYRVRQW
ncbi:MAG TPA: hypothetical protein VFM25_12175, partial [Verrucomicrobiae bacterium]|nr:hypothetical protein [Verrucomicrobiae bacterium]